jgi:DNA invertase Pin-like site-specific DNA recombinase
LPRSATTGEPTPVRPSIRIGYARASTAQQELANQLTALRAADSTRIFDEKISNGPGRDRN